jgi:hypothetical protein
MIAKDNKTSLISKTISNREWARQTTIITMSTMTVLRAISEEEPVKDRFSR